MVGNTEKVIEDLQNQGIPKEDAEKYGDDLVVGNIGKFTLNYQISKNYWLGILYNGFYSSAKLLTRKEYDGYNFLYGELGLVFYRDEVEVMRQQTLLTGVALGQNVDFGFKYFIKPRLAISLDALLFSSKLGKVTAKTIYSTEEINLNEEENNNLSRFDLSFGVVFYW